MARKKARASNTPKRSRFASTAAGRPMPTSASCFHSSATKRSDERVTSDAVFRRFSFMSDSKPSSPSLDRRDLLKGAAATGLASLVDPLTSALAAREPARRDLIRAENEKPGTTDWQLSNTRVDPQTKYRCPWIEGYCSHTS